MSCRLCKTVTGVVIVIALTVAIAAMMSSGGGALPVWIEFITWFGTQFGIEATPALNTFGYYLFTILLAIGASLVYIMADVIDWGLCKICELLGKCNNCKEPDLDPKP
ncbi:hypothetical protein JYT31_00055 [Beggiatoa alba]|nr:hypothetical protein [Beggiatoa alba]